MTRARRGQDEGQARARRVQGEGKTRARRVRYLTRGGRGQTTTRGPSVSLSGAHERPLAWPSQEVGAPREQETGRGTGCVGNGHYRRQKSPTLSARGMRTRTLADQEVGTALNTHRCNRRDLHSRVSGGERVHCGLNFPTKFPQLGPVSDQRNQLFRF